jgi:hypothetical protein
VKQLPSGRDGEEWYEWEERPGPGPPDDTDCPSDEQIIQVRYVERKAKS